MITGIKKRQLSERGRKILVAIAFALFILFIGVVTLIVGKPMISFVSEPEKFRTWVQERGIIGEFSFVLMIFFQVVLALIPGEPLEIGAGYAFGAVKGTILTVIGTVLGSIAVYLLVKRWGVKLCEVFFSKEKIQSLRILKKNKKREILIFLIFFLPGTPKDLVTYFLGLTDVKLSYVIFLSGVARLPSVITSTVGGNEINAKNYLTALTVFGVTLLFSLAGIWIYNKLLTRKKIKESQ